MADGRGHTPTEVEAEFHFDVPHLWIDGELVGTIHEATGGGFSMRLSFPRDGGDFGIAEAKPHLGESAMSGWQGDRGSGDLVAAGVTMVRVTVSCTLPFGRADVEDGHQLPDDLRRSARDILETAEEAARVLLQDYLELVRTQHGQHWLGLSSSQLRVVWLTAVREKEGGGLAPIGGTLKAEGYHPSATLSPECHRVALSRAVGGERPALHEALMADAKYLALRSKPPQLREAVLLAAIACEVVIKHVLREACPRDAQPLLNWALDNPRDVAQQAAGLFHKTAEAVTGRSLHQDDRDVYRGLEALFRARNKVAHRGAPIALEDARRHLAIAEAAIAWAIGLGSNRPTGP